MQGKSLLTQQVRKYNTCTCNAFDFSVNTLYCKGLEQTWSVCCAVVRLCVQGLYRRQLGVVNVQPDKVYEACIKVTVLSESIGTTYLQTQAIV